MSHWRVIREGSYVPAASDSVLMKTNKRIYTLEHIETAQRRQLEIRSKKPSGLSDARFRPALREALDMFTPPPLVVLP